MRPSYVLTGFEAGDRVVLEPAATLGLKDGSLTVEGWLRIYGRDVDLALLASEGADGWSFGVRKGKACVATGDKVTTWSVDLGLDTWVHLAFRCEGGRRVVLVNGVKVVDEAGPAPKLDAAKLWLGGNAGSLAEVRVWNVARTNQQIRDNFTRRMTRAEAGSWVWPLDDGAGKLARCLRADASDHGDAVVGAVWVVDPSLPIAEPTPTGTVASLNGDGATFDVVGSEKLTPGAGFTISVWVCPNAAGELHTGPVMSAHGPNTGWELRCTTLGASFMVTIGGAHREVKSSDPLTSGRWVHLAGVFDGRVISLCLNGVEVARDTPPAGSYSPYGRSLMIGKNREWSDRMFRGQLAEVRLWSGARTQTALQSDLFRRLPSATPTDLLACWRLDEGQGDARDSATGSYPGRIDPGRGWSRVTLAPGSWVTENELWVSLAQRHAALKRRGRDLVTAINVQDELLRAARSRTETAKIRQQIARQQALDYEVEATRRRTIAATIERAKADLQTETAKLEKARAKGSVELSALIVRTAAQLESARSDDSNRGGAFRLEHFDMDLQVIPAADGKSMLLPDETAAITLKDSLSKISLHFEAEPALKVAQMTDVIVPDVGGLTETAARRKLGERELLVTVGAEAVSQDSPTPPGCVVRQVPAAQSPVKRGTTVQIFIAS